VPLHFGKAIHPDRVERIQTILANKRLSLHEISQQSANLFGRSSAFFIPHNLYHDLRDEGFTPSIFQIYAVSHISGYRLADWLRVFGIDLEDIPRLQLLLPRKRSILIDSSLTDTEEWVTWFSSRATEDRHQRIAPLATLLEPMGPNKIAALPGATNSGFLYAKIGNDDALAFPDLLPGSIVRINRQYTIDSAPTEHGAVSHRIFLLEHSKGLFCSRVHWLRDNVLIPLSTKLSYAQVEMRIPAEARILGAIDFEIRSLLGGLNPDVPVHLAKLWKPLPLVERKTFREVLGQARSGTNLSFRESEVLSRRISAVLGDKRYRTSSSSLCDYEVAGEPPRSLHKVVALCCIYGVPFRSLLLSVGIPIDQAGTIPIPDHPAGRYSPGPPVSPADHSGPTGYSGFLEQLLDDWQQVPFFLRGSLGPMTGLRKPSISDFFWIGGVRQSLNPYLVDGILAAVNRRRKTPFHFPVKPLWKQPVYLLQKRDGEYLCACCDLENGTLVVHPYTERFSGALQFRYRKDIEVVGQVVAVLRRIV
jgi:hypothetical protein